MLNKTTSFIRGVFPQQENVFCFLVNSFLNKNFLQLFLRCQSTKWSRYQSPRSQILKLVLLIARPSLFPSPVFRLQPGFEVGKMLTATSSSRTWQLSTMMRTTRIRSEPTSRGGFTCPQGNSWSTSPTRFESTFEVVLLGNHHHADFCVLEGKKLRYKDTCLPVLQSCFWYRQICKLCKISKYTDSSSCSSTISLALSANMQNKQIYRQIVFQFYNIARAIGKYAK